MLSQQSVHAGEEATKQNLELWYKAPAKTWMGQALPLGNGRPGALERFQEAGMELRLPYGYEVLKVECPNAHSDPTIVSYSLCGPPAMIEKTIAMPTTDFEVPGNQVRRDVF